MDEAMQIALAQIPAQKGNVEANIDAHLRTMETARCHGCDFVVFPELSLTGYEPELAAELAFDLADSRLDPLRDSCCRNGITIIAGAPVRHVNRPILGSFVMFPNGACTVYSKRYLHTGEEQFFTPHDWNPLLLYKGEVTSFAICADTNNPMHAKTAHENHSTLYIASVLITPNGYPADTAMLQRHAREYRMTVMMTNYSGFTGGYEAAGGSLVINREGRILLALDSREGILIARRQSSEEWICTGI